MSILRVVLATLAVAPLVTASTCPPLGPVLPPPKSPSQSAIVKAATGKLKATLDGDIKSQFKTSAVSVVVKSLHEDDQLFSYHFTPPTKSGLGTTSVDKNTIYRVGSVSKLMPVLYLLQHNVSFDDPVTKYIPSLKNASRDDATSTPWEDITLGALASHLAGLGTDTASDLAIFPGPWTAMGLPSVPKGTGPTCSGYPGTKACTGDSLVEYLARRPPIYLPYTTPVYSNIAFALMGMVVEAVANRTFESAIQSAIFKPLGMNSSSFNGFPEGFSEKGFIPAGDITWNSTLGVYESAGGFFSTPSDLVTLGTAILSSTLLSPVQTRRWLQPTSHTTSRSFSVGAPWEINRSSTLTSDNRTVDIYTKTGDLGLYHAVLALVPDYDIVVAVLTGGGEVSAEPNARTIILSSVLRGLVSAVEQAGREEVTQNKLVGRFVDVNRNATLTIGMDGGPGLVVGEFSVAGYNVLGKWDGYNLAAALESGAEIGGPAKKVDARLYPTNANTASNNTNQAWRMVVDTQTQEEKKALEEKIFYEDGACHTWFGIDRSVHDYLSLAEFVVITGEEGMVKEVRNQAFNVTFVRMGDAGKVEALKTTGTSSGVGKGLVVNGWLVSVVAMVVVGMV